MKINIDYVGMYKTFLNLQNPVNDLDVLEEISYNIQAIEDLANTGDLELFGHAVDDTTLVYVSKMVGNAKKLHKIFQPLVDDFLGISNSAREEVSKVLPEFLISYGIVLYKRYGYEIIADHYATNNNIDTSKMELPKELFEEVATDLTQVIDTLRTILVVFKTFGAYFAEYQIADSEDLNDVIASLEDRGYGTEAISTLSEKEVQAILEGGNTNG